MTINTEFRTKGTCDMASHAYKMHDVEKMFLDLYKSNCTKKKGCLNYINNMPYHRETKLSQHAMSLHPLYISSISIVIKLTIKNIGEKQQKTNIVDKNVISVSNKYTVHM